jgi:GTP 3',8-cyclase
MSGEIAIDGHKLHMHPEEVARWLKAQDRWSEAKSIYPIYVEVSPFGGCNFRCTFCAKDFLKYKNIKIDAEVLKRTFSSMRERGVKSVLFAGEGEPTLHPELGNVIEHCHSIGLDTALGSNLATGNRDAFAAAARHSKWIKASVNAGNVRDHKAVHQTHERSFEKVFENIRFCVDTRNEHRSQNPTRSACTIGAQAVLLEDNRHSMVELARRCRDAGADYFVIKPYSQHPESLTHRHEGIDYGFVEELSRELKNEETGSFKVFCRPASFSKAASAQPQSTTPASTAPRYGTCYSVPLFWAYIRADGEVIGCSNFMLDSRFNYGNINKASFEEIWEGPARQAAFEYMIHSHDISKCRVNCRMDKVNEYLWDIRHPSSHVNFI